MRLAGRDFTMNRGPTPSIAFFDEVLVPLRDQHNQIFRSVWNRLATQSRIHIDVAGRVEHVFFIFSRFEHDFMPARTLT